MPQADNEFQRLNWRIQDFCKANGICKSTFYNFVKQGRIRTFKVGKIALISDAEVRRFQHEHSGEPVS